MVEIIDTLKPKNNGDFPVVEASDVSVDEKRLSEILGGLASAESVEAVAQTVETKANKSELEEVERVVDLKADKTETDSLQEQINNIISPVTQDAEVQQAREDMDKVFHATLNERLKTDFNNAKADALQTTGAVGRFEKTVSTIEGNAFITKINGNFKKSDSIVINTEGMPSVVKQFTVKNSNGTTLGIIYSGGQVLNATLNADSDYIQISANGVNVIGTGNIEIKLTIEGKLFDDVEKLKAKGIEIDTQLNSYNNILYPSFTVGKGIETDKEQTRELDVEYLKSAIIPVLEGERYHITGVGTTYFLPYATTDENKNIIRRCENANFNGDIVIEQGERFLVINANTGYNSDAFCYSAFDEVRKAIATNAFILNNVSEDVAGVVYKSAEPNILPPTQTTGYYDPADGHIVNDLRYRRNPDYIELKEYTTQLYQYVADDSDAAVVISCYDAEKNYIGFSARGTLSNVINLKSGAVYIRVYTRQEYPIADVCLSYKDIGQFSPFTLVPKIKPSALPDVDVKKKLDGKTIVNFGDSIFGLRRPESISTFLADISGATVHNLGFGGCRMGYDGRPNWEPFSMKALAHSIATGDFSAQNAIDIPTVPDMPAYFAIARSLLTSIDYSKVDIATISYGTNDFAGGLKPMENPDDLKDVNTFAGALRYSIESILTVYPNIRIFILTPCYRMWLDESGAVEHESDTYEVAGYKLTDYVEKAKAIAKEYKLSVIDNYYDLGFNPYNFKEWYRENDGTHHNAKGAKVIAEHMANELY